PIPLTLNLAKNVSSFNASSLIPAGSQIVGELVTMQDQQTAQFVAKELVLSDGQRIEISASSRIVERTSEISKNQKVDRIIKNSALGTAAAAAFAAMSGNPIVASQQVLLNSGFGSSAELIGAFRNQEKVTIITIFPNSDFTLTLNSDLVLK
ncbi:MAG: S-layer homology domain-containing protein, partial [Phormidium sp.]